MPIIVISDALKAELGTANVEFNAVVMDIEAVARLRRERTRSSG
jgi:hypothetical protein